MAGRSDSWRGGGTGRGGYTFEAVATSQVAATAKGVVGQTADIFRVLNSDDTVLFAVDPSGNLTIAGTATIVIDQAVTGNVTATGNLTVSGDGTINGDVTLGDAATDTLTVNAFARFTADVVTNHNLTVNNTLNFNGFAYGNVLFFNEQTNDPSAILEKGALYTKDSGGITELFYIDSAGSVAQITTAGVAGFDSDTIKVIDVTSTEALLVRKDGDGGDVFAVNTSGGKVLITPIITSSNGLDIQAAAGITSGNVTLVYNNNSTHTGNVLSVWQDHASATSQALEVRQDANTTALFVDGNGTGSGIIVDATGVEALLVRKASDGGDVFTVNTTNGISTFTNPTDAAANQVAILQSDRATPGDADSAYISFQLSHDGAVTSPAQYEFARMTVIANDVSEDSEDGMLRLSFSEAGVLTSGVHFTGAGGTVFSNTAHTAVTTGGGATIPSTSGHYAVAIKPDSNRRGRILILGTVTGGAGGELMLESSSGTDGQRLWRVSTNQTTTDVFEIQNLDDSNINTTNLTPFSITTDGLFTTTTNLNNAEGNEVAFTINYTTNKATSGNDTGLVINQTDTGSPGVSLLAAFQTATVQKWAVDNAGLVEESVTAGITASTTQTQGNGALTTMVNEVATVANASDTVTLPTAVAGRRIYIINNGANTLQIFPADGDDLGAGLNTATTLASGSNVTFLAYDATNWETV